MSFAGISVFPVQDEYNATITLLSSTDGSSIGSKSASAPSPISTLSETIKSLLSQFPEPSLRLKSYIGTVPPAFPPDEYFQVLSALTFSLNDSELSTNSFPSLLSSHATAYCANLPKDQSAFMLFLDFSTHTRLSTAYLRSTDTKGKRETTSVHEESISFIQQKSVQKILKEAISLQDAKEPLERIVVHDPPTEIASDIETVISTEHPGVPIFKTTRESISQAAATLIYAKSLNPSQRILAQYVVPLPISIATSSGSTVLLVPAMYRIPLDQFITLTTSKDGQTSVTVRLLLGNHPLAKDNLGRGIAVLNGLKPMPKGITRIRVSIEVSVRDGWRDAAQIRIEQEDGVGKTFMFSRFFEGLTDDDEDKYEVESKKDDGYEQLSEQVVGDLPE